MQGKVFTSDDHGKSWNHRVNFPFMHARPFVSGQSVYVLGQANDLTIIRSDDRGQTWSEPAKLTEGENWHQAPSNVHYANGHIYLVMEKRIAHRVTGWAPSEFAPVLMRAKIGDDLTRRENWTFASELAFCDVVCDRDLDYFGVPFFPVWYPNCKTLVPGRHICPMGWLETNVVQFTDPDHVWHDPAGRTFHLWMRANTTMTGYACIAQVKEHADGSMTTSLVKSPSDKKMVFVPCPGGQNKFHVLYDEKTAQYWLVSVQSRDSMTKPEKLSPLRFNEPANERRWLQLYFSKNMIDWQFAGLVAQGAADNAARHYASMAIDGDDLHILSRSGDVNAKSAHDGNITTFHTIKDFRNLLY
jgi:hypothetical protein